jgi:hypothetical protein
VQPVYKDRQVAGDRAESSRPHVRADLSLPLLSTPFPGWVAQGQCTFSSECLIGDQSFSSARKKETIISSVHESMVNIPLFGLLGLTSTILDHRKLYTDQFPTGVPSMAIFHIKFLWNVLLRTNFRGFLTLGPTSWKNCQPLCFSTARSRS